MSNSASDPFLLLHEMEQASRASAPGLPQQTEVAAVWSGLGFRVADLRLVVPLDQVSEVVPFAGATVVPGAKRWLKGIANVRGDLLAIVDLADFLGREPVALDAECRLLVLNVPGLSSAVLVSEVLGLRHFYEDQDRVDTAQVDGVVRDYLQGAFAQHDILWGVFDVGRLGRSDAFRHAAA
jgi:twitching motility protein PilI